MVPEQDPAVVYAVVTALIVALGIGIFFASPLRVLLTGKDEPLGLGPPDSPQPLEAVANEHEAPADETDSTADGPWSTAPPTHDRWPKT